MNRPRRHASGLPKYCYKKPQNPKPGQDWSYVLYLPGPDGKRRSKSFGKDLRALYAAWIDAYETPAHYVTLGDLMDKYQAQDIPKLAPRTQSDYQRYLANLRPIFGHMRPDTLTATDIYQWQELRGAQSIVGANREKAVLRNILQLAVKLGLAQTNIVRQVPNLTERPRDRLVTEAEFAQVYNLASDIVQIAMLLAILTGMRQGDLLTLRRDQLHNDGIRYTPSKTQNRGAKRILIEWSNTLRQTIDRALNLRRVKSLYVLSQRNGQPYTGDGFRSIWNRTLRQAQQNGLAERFTFHDLRAMAGSKTADWRLLGHLDQRTFNRVYDRSERRVKPTE